MKILLKFNLIFCFVTFLYSINSYSQQTDSLVLKDAVIYYYTYGSGEPIILLSGGPGWNYMQVSDIAQELSSKYKVIVPDQRGTGLSWTKPMDSTTINLNVAVEDINLLRNKLGINRMNLYGHSFGGMLACAYTAKYPENVKLLILVGSGELTYDYYQIVENSIDVRSQLSDSAEFKYWSDSTNCAKNPEKAKMELRRIEYYKYIYDRKKIEVLLSQFSKATKNDKMAAIMWKSFENKNYDLTTQLKAYKGKVLLIFGWQDPIGICTFQHIKEVMPQSAIRGIDQCGHFPSIEQPKAFFNILTEYLSENM